METVRARRQAVCAEEGKAREEELPKSFGAQKTLSESQMSMLLDFGSACVPWIFPLEIESMKLLLDFAET